VRIDSVWILTTIFGLLGCNGAEVLTDDTGCKPELNEVGSEEVVELGYSAEDALDIVNSPSMHQLRWYASGAETALTITMSLDETQSVFYDSAFCDRKLMIPVSAVIATADSLLDEHIDTTLLTRAGGPEPELEVDIPRADVQGTFDAADLVSDTGSPFVALRIQAVFEVGWSAGDVLVTDDVESPLRRTLVGRWDENPNSSRGPP